jgi:hypothetical protein
MNDGKIHLLSEVISDLLYAKKHLLNEDYGFNLYAHCGKKLSVYFSHDCFGNVNPGTRDIEAYTKNSEECDCESCLEKYKVWTEEKAALVIKRLNRDSVKTKDENKIIDHYVGKMKQCFKCDKQFKCGLIGDYVNCWCTKYPNMLEITNESCMCEECLKEEIKELRENANQSNRTVSSS